MVLRWATAEAETNVPFAEVPDVPTVHVSHGVDRSVALCALSVEGQSAFLTSSAFLVHLTSFFTILFNHEVVCFLNCESNL